MAHDRGIENPYVGSETEQDRQDKEDAQPLWNELKKVVGVLHQTIEDLEPISGYADYQDVIPALDKLTLIRQDMIVEPREIDTGIEVDESLQPLMPRGRERR